MGLDSFLKMIPLVIEKNSDVEFIIGGAKGPLDSLAHHYAELYKDFVILKKDIPFSELQFFILHLTLSALHHQIKEHVWASA